jgi:tripartite-type tricarboxylate transporter receptor subunit TctC
MTRMPMTRAFIAVIGLLLLLTPRAQAADSPATNFYQGKTIQVVVGFGAGGSFDLMARVLARYMGKHIPGNPTMVVQNMPGAGSLAATQYVYTRPPEGLFIGALHGAVINGQVTGTIQGQFDPQKLLWLGQIGSGAVPRLFLVRPEVATDLAGFLAVQKSKTVYIGTAGQGSTYHEFAKYLQVIGLNVGVIAYKGGREIWTSLERGEVDAVSDTFDTVGTIYKGYVDRKIAVPIFWQGPPPPEALEPGSAFKEIPTFETLAAKLKTPEDQLELYRYLINVYSLERLYALPPGTPADRVAMLRHAFDEMIENDEDARREIGKVIPGDLGRSGEEVEKEVRLLAHTPPNVAALYRKYFASEATK